MPQKDYSAIRRSPLTEQKANVPFTVIKRNAHDPNTLDISTGISLEDALIPVEVINTVVDAQMCLDISDVFTIVVIGSCFKSLPFIHGLLTSTLVAETQYATPKGSSACRICGLDTNVSLIHSCHTHPTVA